MTTKAAYEEVWIHTKRFEYSLHKLYRPLRVPS